jgi:hypothetical protein
MHTIEYDSARKMYETGDHDCMQNNRLRKTNITCFISDAESIPKKLKQNKNQSMNIKMIYWKGETDGAGRAQEGVMDV